MDYATVMKNIQAGKIVPVYLLAGEESFLHRQVEQAVVHKVLTREEQAMNLHIFEQDMPLAQCRDLLCSMPFWGSKQVVIVRHTNLFIRKNADHGEAAEKLEKNDGWAALLKSVPAHCHVIFSMLQRPDGRLALLRVVKEYGAVVELNPLRLSEICSWARQQVATMDKTLSPAACHYLQLSFSGTEKISLAVLNNELEKACIYVGTRKEITAEDLAVILAAGQEYSIFALLRFLERRDRAAALQILCCLHEQGEQPMHFIALLARQVRLIWQAKECLASGVHGRALATRLAVPPFVAEIAARQAHQLTTASLHRALRLLARLDREVKNGLSPGLEDLLVLVNILAS